MLCGEEMRLGMPRAGAGEAPCPGNIIAFSTYPLSDQRPRLARHSGLCQTTPPDILGAQSGLPLPACWANRGSGRTAVCRTPLPRGGA